MAHHNLCYYVVFASGDGEHQWKVFEQEGRPTTRKTGIAQMEKVPSCWAPAELQTRLLVINTNRAISPLGFAKLR